MRTSNTKWVSNGLLPFAEDDRKFGWLNGWLVGFVAYQPFLGHLMPNQVILMKILF